jgi:exonuclease SbcC
LTAAFAQTPAARKATFDVLLQVDEYKIAFDRLLEVRAVLKERRQTVATDLAVVQMRLAQLPQLEANLRERQVELGESQSTLESVQIGLAAVLAERRTLETAAAAVEAATLKEATLAEKLRSAEQSLAHARRSLEEALAAQALVAEQLPAHDRYVAAQAHKTELETAGQRRQQLLKRQAEADKAAGLLQREAHQVAEQLAGVTQAEATVLALAVDVARQREWEVQQAAAGMDAKQLAELDRQNARLAAQAAELRTRRQQINAQLAQAAGLQAESAAAEVQTERLREELAAHLEAVTALTTTANAIKAQNAALADIATAQCPICEQPLTATHRDEMMGRNASQLQAMRAEAATHRSRQKQIEGELVTQGAALKSSQEKLLHLPRPAELETVGQAITAVEGELHQLDEKRVQLATAPQRLQTATDALKALGNPAQKSAVAANTAANRPLLETQAAAIQQKLRDAQETLAEQTRLLAQYSTLEQDLAAVNAQLQAAQPGYQAVLANRKQAELAPQRQQALTAAAALGTETAAALVAAREALAAARQRFDPAALSRVALQEQGWQSQQGSLQTRIAMLTAQQKMEEAEMARLRELQPRARALAQQDQAIADQQTALDAVRTALKQAGPFITQSVIHQVSTEAGQTFGEMMQDHSRKLRWGEDYGVTLEVDGVQRSFAQLSGGEQMSAALAVRLALVRSMSNIHIAFFDEPTAHLDEGRRAALAQQITSVKGFHQLFVISHDDTFEQATDNLVRVWRSEEGSKVAMES